MNQYRVGEKVVTKKKHPCGSDVWEVIREGVDYKLKCLGCSHVIMIEREKAYKMIKKKLD